MSSRQGYIDLIWLHKESKGDVNPIRTGENPWRYVDNQVTLKKIIRIQQVRQIALNQ